VESLYKYKNEGQESKALEKCVGEGRNYWASRVYYLYPARAGLVGSLVTDIF